MEVIKGDFGMNACMESVIFDVEVRKENPFDLLKEYKERAEKDVFFNKKMIAAVEEYIRINNLIEEEVKEENTVEVENTVENTVENKSKFTKDERNTFLNRIKHATGFYKKYINLINVEYIYIKRASLVNSCDSSVLFEYKDKYYELYSSYTGYNSALNTYCVREV